MPMPTCPSSPSMHACHFRPSTHTKGDRPALLPVRTPHNIFIMFSHLKRWLLKSSPKTSCLLLTSALLASPTRAAATHCSSYYSFAFLFPSVHSLPSWGSPLLTLQDPNSVHASSIKSSPMSSLTPPFPPQILHSSLEISFHELLLIIRWLTLDTCAANISCLVS